MNTHKQPYHKEDTNMKYIAYGSNMAQDQMARRCPDAKLIGTAKES